MVHVLSLESQGECWDVLISFTEQNTCVYYYYSIIIIIIIIIIYYIYIPPHSRSSLGGLQKLNMYQMWEQSRSKALLNNCT